MNESFVLGHIMSRNSDPEMVERAVAEYQSTPNLTNFCTLLFIPPADLPATVLDDVPGRFTELTQLLVDSEQTATFLRDHASQGFPFTLSTWQLQYWTGVLRVCHGIYQTNIPWVLAGYQLQILGLVGRGKRNEARELFQQLSAAQEEYGAEVVRLEELDHYIRHAETVDKQAHRASNAVIIYSPFTGRLVPLSQVSESFAEKYAGKGYAIYPSEGTLQSPAAGTITAITSHGGAYRLKTVDPLGADVEVLIHISAHPWDLSNDYFQVAVRDGAQVAAKQTLCEFDMEAMNSNDDHNSSSPVVIKNYAGNGTIRPIPSFSSTKQINAGDPLIMITT